jgi:hypothetical protein
MFRLYPRFVAGQEKPLQPCMPERSNHEGNCTA